MGHIFISHVGEDEEAAVDLARGLEASGYKTWYYERDSLPGASYLLQTGQAVEDASAVVVLVTPKSVESNQVTAEVVRAHEAAKRFIPVLRGITHAEFQQRQPEWREAMGSAASVQFPPEGAGAIVPRIVAGLTAMKIAPGESKAAASAAPKAEEHPAKVLKPHAAALLLSGAGAGLFFGGAFKAVFYFLLAKEVSPRLDWICAAGGAAFGFLILLYMVWVARSAENETPEDLRTEGLVAHGPANHFLNAENRGGRLFLTRRRLVFAPHKAVIQADRVEVPLNRITAADEDSHLGIIPTKIKIKLDSGVTHCFTVWRRSEWLETIYAARKEAA